MTYIPDSEKNIVGYKASIACLCDVCHQMKDDCVHDKKYAGHGKFEDVTICHSCTDDYLRQRKNKETP